MKNKLFSELTLEERKPYEDAEASLSEAELQRLRNIDQLLKWGLLEPTENGKGIAISVKQAVKWKTQQGMEVKTFTEIINNYMRTGRWG